MRSAWAWAAAGLQLGFSLSLMACSAAPMQSSSTLDQRDAAQSAAVESVRSERLDLQRTSGSRVRAAEVPFSFERGGQQFEGVVAMPERRSGERLPGVVLVHGSGPMSRDGFMHGQLGLGFGFDFPVYAELSRELVKLGYVVARYDKRTCVGTGTCANLNLGASNSVADALLNSLEMGDTVVDDFVEDAKAAYGKLAEYEFVDIERSVFVGHSQGAQLVPRLLTELEQVPSGVMLTPPYRNVPELLRQQGQLLVRVMRQAGKPEREGEGHELIRAAKLLAALQRGEPTPPRILGQPLALWRSWIRASQEAPVLARSLTRPLLVIGGTYDYNVAPGEMRLWSQWFLGSRHQVTVLPCVTHALNCISQVDPTQIEARHIGRSIDEALVQRLADFLRTTVGESRK